MAELSISENIIYLTGELKTGSIKSLWDRFKLLVRDKSQSELLIDLSAVTAIDSAGVAFLDELKSRYSTSQRTIQYCNIPAAIQTAMISFSLPEVPATSLKQRVGFFESIGDKAIQFKNQFMFLLLLMADIFYWSIIGLFQRKGQREGSFVQQSVLIGVNALQIVALISFLIGLILALQSAAQLRQFGANIFVADLIGIAMLKEMGPIMTAIVIAGRSGSAIASEIATMVVTEEIDALKTMSLNPIRYVVVPKFHGITLTMPLLTILADLVGILGGFVIAITYLQLSASAFFNELVTVLILKDVLTGLFKSVIFAWIIVIVACYQGLRVTGGAEGVGRATTASVVASIFFVIVADSILGLIFYFE
ncbi:MAG: MlaE family lipid ABC transporter permease subunit [bacterium]|nr:MAG: MlaE family lipid ABC transporter permease subunit [bacterium]